jgi:hypothetical protein
MKTMKHFFCVIVIVLLVNGCSSSGISTVNVSGDVSYQGKPLENALVVFLPVVENKGIRGASATTDANGKFTLETLGATKTGAMLGNYNVVVTKEVQTNQEQMDAEYAANKDNPSYSSSTMPQFKNLLPKKYAEQSTTPLKAEVKKGKNHFVFELTE